MNSTFCHNLYSVPRSNQSNDIFSQFFWAIVDQLVDWVMVLWCLVWICDISYTVGPRPTAGDPFRRPKSIFRCYRWFNSLWCWNSSYSAVSWYCINLQRRKLMLHQVTAPLVDAASSYSTKLMLHQVTAPLIWCYSCC